MGGDIRTCRVDLLVVHAALDLAACVPRAVHRVSDSHCPGGALCQRWQSRFRCELAALAHHSLRAMGGWAPGPHRSCEASRPAPPAAGEALQFPRFVRHHRCGGFWSHQRFTAREVLRLVHHQLRIGCHHQGRIVAGPGWVWLVASQADHSHLGKAGWPQWRVHRGATRPIRARGSGGATGHGGHDRRGDFPVPHPATAAGTAGSHAPGCAAWLHPDRAAEPAGLPHALAL